jgi:16S rRNA (adenine1518-N6/adenine1519-N6)-dimethyltransferase
MGAKLGQNFLTDPNILRKIIALTVPDATQTVVEVGCGDGILTRALLDTAKKLYVIEIDETCITKTKENLLFPSGRGALPDESSALPSSHPIFILGDVLEVGFHAVALEDRPFRIIANIPYYISAKFIALCAAHKHDLTDVTLMLQWEFAKKLVSKPGESGYTPLAIFAQMHFDIRLDFQVSRHCFRPAPKVDSAIVTLTPKALPEDLVHDEGFFLFVKAVFWGRRKPLKSALHKSPYWTVKEGYVTHPIWEKMGSTRAEILSREQLLDTYRVLAPYLERVASFKRREVLDLA